MIRDVLGTLQITLNLKRNVIDEILRVKSAASSGRKLFVLWTIAALMINLLMLTNLGLANQNDYTSWGLPEGAKARIGKGTFTDMQLSRDGTRLAIASSTGVWLYDVSTGDPPK